MSWAPVDNNCGTGAGGFKKGNTCAQGSAASFSTVQALGKAINPPGSKPYRISATAEIPGVTQIGREVHGIPRANFKEYMDTLLKRYEDLGFKPSPGSSGWSGDNVVLEHPEGHQLELIVSKQTSANSVYMGVSFVPPAQREGYQVSREAFTHSLDKKIPASASQVNRVPFGLDELLLRSASTDAKFLRSLHERFISHHIREASGNAPAVYIDWHRKAAGLHNMARDYYMDKLGVQNHWSSI